MNYTYCNRKGILMLNLETNRLMFRRYAMDDLAFVEQLVTNENVMKYIGSGVVKDRAYAIQLIERMMEQYDNFDDYGLHVLVHKDTGQRIGHAGLVAQIIDDAFEIELGYWIHSDFWQQGYATEATRALKQYAEQELELERYVSAIQVGNVASQKVALQNGLKLEKQIEMEGKQVEIYVNAL